MGCFGTAKIPGYEYKKREWCKERNTCGKTNDGIAGYTDKILMKIQKMGKHKNGHNLTTR